MKIQVQRNSDVRFKRETGDGKYVERGFGFLTEEKTIGLIRCPECGAENYAPNVLSGNCSWCQFESNKINFE